MTLQAVEPERAGLGRPSLDVINSVVSGRGRCIDRGFPMTDRLRKWRWHWRCSPGCHGSATLCRASRFCHRRHRSRWCHAGTLRFLKSRRSNYSDRSQVVTLTNRGQQATDAKPLTGGPLLDSAGRLIWGNHRDLFAFGSLCRHRIRELPGLIAASV